ncbi:MAG: GNAT family N-acetyltransferase [Micropruina sp.]|nr:N-acetyltransferase [Micropruina sp.]
MDEVLTHNRETSRFELRIDGALVGYAHYRLKNGVAIFDSTVVKPEFRGHGIASRLMDFAVEQVRAEQGWRIRPVCSFVVDYAKRNPAVADLIV